MELLRLDVLFLASNALIKSANVAGSICNSNIVEHRRARPDKGKIGVLTDEA